MKRKLVAQGSGKGFVLYVPKKWTDKKELEAGDYLDIEETEEGNLLIKSEKFDRNKKTSVIHITEKNKQFIKSIINSTYRLGYDRIIVSYSSEKEFKKIENVINSQLLGFEIVEKNKKELIIENITEPADQKEEILLRRIFMILADSYEILENSLKNNDFSMKNKIHTNSEKIAAFANFCRRSICKKKSEKEPLYYQLFALLNYNQRGIIHFYTMILEKKLIVSDKEIEQIKLIRKEILNLISAFYSKKLDLIEKSNKILNKINNDILNENTPTNSKQLYHFISEQSRLTYLTTTPILGILL